VLAKYKAKHPSLLVSGHVHEYVDTRRIQSSQGGQQKEVLLGSIRIVEVFAFYRDGVPDTGTVLRFVERSGCVYCPRDHPDHPLLIPSTCLNVRISLTYLDGTASLLFQIIC